MSVRARVAVSVLPAALLAGCGDGGGECVSPAFHEPSSGLFASPADFAADFDDAGCVPGSLADLDPGGLWFIEETGMTFFSRGGPVRFSLSCEAGLGVETANVVTTSTVDDAFLDGDDLFWRRERSFDDGALVFVDAYDLCGLEADGSLVGRAAHCSITSDDERCGGAEVRVQRFERLPGEAEADGLELVSEFSGGDAPWPATGHALNVRVEDGVAYLARGPDGLRIVDVSDPEAPADLGWLELPEDDINDVKIVPGPGGSRWALLGSDSRGLLIAEVTDPRAPRLVHVISPSGEPAHGVHSVFTERVGDAQLAYLADGFSEIVTFWDVTDPETPFKVGEVAAGHEDWAVHDLYADAGRLYLNATVGGLVIVDTQPDPSAPVVIGQALPEEPVYSHANWVTEAGGRLVSISGGEGYRAHFRVIDVDPDSPEFTRELGAYQTRPQVSAHNVIAIGERAYAAYYQDGVRVLDLSDPTAPKLAAYFNTWSPESAIGSRFEGAVGIDVDLEAGLIYVADTPRGLLILRETGR